MDLRVFYRNFPGQLFFEALVPIEKSNAKVAKLFSPAVAWLSGDSQPSDVKKCQGFPRELSGDAFECNVPHPLIPKMTNLNNAATPSDVLAQEISLSIHLTTGNLLDQGWPMETVQEAIRKAADLLPLLESQNE